MPELDISPVRLAAALSGLAPGDPLLVAAALGVEMAHRRTGMLLTDDYPGGRYHRNNLLPAVSELQRRRYPPTGSRDLWIRYGPAGPPWSAERDAA